VLKNLINIKQKDDESLIYYTPRFESVRDLAVAHFGGHIVLLNIIENDAFQQSNKRTITARERYMVYLYMERADQAKFGSLLSNLKFQSSLGHNQYQKTLAAPGSILDQHQWNEGLNNKRLVKRHPDTKSKIRKPIINPKK
jgi:hypothetical protein